MNVTRHMTQRMNQRGINKIMVEAALDFGTPHKDRHSLGRKEAQAAIAQLQGMLKVLTKVADKGGITVVVENGTYITAWNQA